jgi:hypothetical protein
MRLWRALAGDLLTIDTYDNCWAWSEDLLDRRLVTEVHIQAIQPGKPAFTVLIIKASGKLLEPMG